MTHPTHRGPLLLTTGAVLLLMGMTYVVLTAWQVPGADANRTYWLMTRSAGFVSYELLAVTVCLGLLGGISRGKGPASGYLVTLHQLTALLVMPFLLLHLVALHNDTTIPFPWLTVAVPFTASYRPFFTGLGTLAAYTLLVLWISSLIRPRIGLRTWRTIHTLWLPVFFAITLHGLFSGSDSEQHWARMLYFVTTLTTVAIMCIRFFRKGNNFPINRRA